MQYNHLLSINNVQGNVLAIRDTTVSETRQSLYLGIYNVVSMTDYNQGITQTTVKPQ